MPNTVGLFSCKLNDFLPSAYIYNIKNNYEIKL